MDKKGPIQLVSYSSRTFERFFHFVFTKCWFVRTKHAGCFIRTDVSI